MANEAVADTGRRVDAMPIHNEEPDDEKTLLAEDEDDIAVIREREKGKFLTLDELKQRHGWEK